MNPLCTTAKQYRSLDYCTYSKSPYLWPGGDGCVTVFIVNLTLCVTDCIPDPDSFEPGSETAVFSVTVLLLNLTLCVTDCISDPDSFESGSEMAVLRYLL